METYRKVMTVGIVLLLGVAGAMMLTGSTNLGSAPSGLASTVATSSSLSVTATGVTTVIPASANCASRILSPQGGVLKVTIGGGTPSATKGMEVAASSTAVFDGALYGCGDVKIYSYATQQVTATETR